MGGLSRWEFCSSLVNLLALIILGVCEDHSTDHLGRFSGFESTLAFEFAPVSEFDEVAIAFTAAPRANPDVVDFTVLRNTIRCAAVLSGVFKPSIVKSSLTDDDIDVLGMAEVEDNYGYNR